MNQGLRLGSTPLSVQVLELPPYVVGQWIGDAPDTARQVAEQAVAEVLSRPGERVIFDFARLAAVSDCVTGALAESINRAQRLGRDVCLVRCSDQLYSRLQRAGLSGAVTHAASLLAATQGMSGDAASTLDLYLRSTPELLRRVRSVVAAVAAEARLSGDVQHQIKSAVTEAAANAILHGSPEGPRNHVRVSFFLDPECLIVDIADQGRGFDPKGVPVPEPEALRENGYGIFLMRQAMDRVEFYRDERGMLVRMTKLLSKRGAECLQ